MCCIHSCPHKKKKKCNLPLPGLDILWGLRSVVSLVPLKALFSLCHVKYILFLVNYLSLSTSSIPLCGLAASAGMQVVFHCRKMYTSHDWWLLFSHGFTLVVSASQSCPSCEEHNTNTCSKNKFWVVVNFFFWHPWTSVEGEAEGEGECGVMAPQRTHSSNIWPMG